MSLCALIFAVDVRQRESRACLRHIDQALLEFGSPSILTVCCHPLMSAESPVPTFYPSLMLCRHRALLHGSVLNDHEAAIGLSWTSSLFESVRIHLGYGSKTDQIMKKCAINSSLSTKGIIRCTVQMYSSLLVSIAYAWEGGPTST